jgi:hypothetical protein
MTQTPPPPPPPPLSPPGPSHGAGSRSWRKIVVVLLVLGVVGIAAIALLGGGDGDDVSGGSETVQAVVDYLDAARDGDCEALIDLVTEASVQLIGGGGRPEAIAACEDALDSDEELAAAGLGRIESTEEIVDSDGMEATVTVTTVDDDGQPTYSFFTLRSEDGVWKLDVTDTEWAPTSSR